MCISPIGLVPKKAPGKYRIIHHLSFPQGSSVNSGIPDEAASVHYSSIDDAIQKIKRLGKGCYLVKLDIESAFKIVPVHPEDHHLLGFSWKGCYYFDKTLPMGLRSSCSIFEKISHAIEWAARDKARVEELLHLLDDFLLLARSFKRSERDKQNFISLCETLRIPLAADKLEGPATCLTFAGIILDTVKWEARLPEEKRFKCIEKIHTLLNHNKTTLRELQS